MCYDEGMIQAYIDGELSPEEMEEICGHLKTCERCRTKYEEMREIDIFVKDRMHVEEVSIPASKDMAWEKFRQRLGKKYSEKRGAFYMINKYKKAVAVVAAALLISSAIWVAPVRNAAADFLNIFRVSGIKPITFTEEDFNRIQQQFNEKGIRNIDLKQYGKIKVEGGGGEGRSVSEEDGFKDSDVDSIKRDLGVEFITPKVPEGFKLTSVEVERAGRIEITPNVANLNKLISTFGGTELFPKALGDKTFVITTKNIVHMNYSKGAVDGANSGFQYINVTQMATPDIEVPDGVDLASVRNAVISIPFIPENIKQQLADIKDWKNTLPLPVGDESSIKEVTVNGNSGVLTTNRNSNKAGDIYSALIWADGKYMFEISGTLAEQNMLQMAESLR